MNYIYFDKNRRIKKTTISNLYSGSANADEIFIFAEFDSGEPVTDYRVSVMFRKSDGFKIGPVVTTPKLETDPITGEENKHCFSVLLGKDCLDVSGPLQISVNYHTTHIDPITELEEDVIVATGMATANVYKNVLIRNIGKTTELLNLEAIINEFVGNVVDLESDKVDKVDGKQLSTEDFTTAEKAKLLSVESGAEVNPTKLSELENDVPFAKQVDVDNSLNNLNADNIKSGTLNPSRLNLGHNYIWSGEHRFDQDFVLVRTAGRQPKIKGRVSDGSTTFSFEWELPIKSGRIALEEDVNKKVDKVDGKQLSSEDFTTEEKEKLAYLESSHFKGEYHSIEQLEEKRPVAGSGDYAYVDSGAGYDVQKYIWDTTDNKWVLAGNVLSDLTPAQVKQLYEENINTNAFTDALKDKLEELDLNYVGTTKSKLNILKEVEGMGDMPIAEFDGSEIINLKAGDGIELNAVAKENPEDPTTIEITSLNEYDEDEKTRVDVLENEMDKRVEKDLTVYVDSESEIESSDLIYFDKQGTPTAKTFGELAGKIAVDSGTFIASADYSSQGLGADKAVKDGDGNIIKDTYEKKGSVFLDVVVDDFTLDDNPIDETVRIKHIEGKETVFINVVEGNIASGGALEDLTGNIIDPDPNTIYYITQDLDLGLWTGKYVKVLGDGIYEEVTNPPSSSGWQISHPTKIISKSNNLFEYDKTKIVDGKYYSNSGALANESSSQYYDQDIIAEQGKTYYFSGEVLISQWGFDNVHIGRIQGVSYAPTSNVKHFRISNYMEGLTFFNNFMMNFTNVFIPYQPYAEHIYPLGDGVDLLKLPNEVGDEWYPDGSVEKNVSDKFTFDGSEHWILNNVGQGNNIRRFYCMDKMVYDISSTNVPVITNSKVFKYYDESINIIKEKVVYGSTNNQFYIYIDVVERFGLPVDSDNAILLSTFKDWLSNNNLEVYYQLATPEIEQAEPYGEYIGTYDKGYLSIDDGLMALKIPVSITAQVNTNTKKIGKLAEKEISFKWNLIATYPFSDGEINVDVSSFDEIMVVYNDDSMGRITSNQDYIMFPKTSVMAILPHNFANSSITVYNNGTLNIIWDLNATGSSRKDYITVYGR